MGLHKYVFHIGGKHGFTKNLRCRMWRKTNVYKQKPTTLVAGGRQGFTKTLAFWVVGRRQWFTQHLAYLMSELLPTDSWAKLAAIALSVVIAKPGNNQ